MGIPSELDHVAVATNFVALKKNQLAQTSLEPGTSRPRVIRSAVASHWLNFLGTAFFQHPAVRGPGFDTENLRSDFREEPIALWDVVDGHKITAMAVTEVVRLLVRIHQRGEQLILVVVSLNPSHLQLASTLTV